MESLFGENCYYCYRANSVLENRPLFVSILTSGMAVFGLASNIAPEINKKFGQNLILLTIFRIYAFLELVQFPDSFRNMLVFCLIADLFICFLIDRSLNFLFGDMQSVKQYNKDK